MADPFSQFNYVDPVTGQPRAARSSADVPGQVGFVGESVGANGRTASGDASNPFRGFRSAHGGGFGGYDSVVDPRTGVTAKNYDTRVGTAIRGFQPDWSKVDRNAMQRSYTPETIGGQLNALEGFREKAFRGESLSDTEQAQLAASDDPTNNPFRSANDAMRLGRNFQTGAAIDPSITNYHDRAMAAGAMTPEQAAHWKAFPERFAARQAEEQQENTRLANADPFGRNESTTAAANVIKPGQNRMAQMQPNAFTTADPFAAFTPGFTPQAAPTPNPVFGAPQAPGQTFAPTFANLRTGIGGATDVGGDSPIPGVDPPDPTGGSNPAGPFSSGMGLPPQTTQGPLAGTPAASPPAAATGFGMGFRPLHARGQRQGGFTGLFNRMRPIKKALVPGGAAPPPPTGPMAY